MFFKDFREKLGISQKEALKKLGIQQATLSKYESLSIPPSSLVIKKYCETLNANPTFLFFGQGPHLLSAAPKVSVENGYLLDDLSCLFLQEELAQKLREILIEAVREKVRGIIKDVVFVKLLDAFTSSTFIKQRQFHFLYYFFYIISISKNKPNITIQNAKNFILETIEGYKTLLSDDNAQKEILQLFEARFSEDECFKLLEQVDTVLLLLERNMDISTMENLRISALPHKQI